LPAASTYGIPAAIEGLKGLLKPSGWIQSIEADHGVFTGPAMGDMWKLVQAVFEGIGLRADIAKTVLSLFEKAGLRDVGENVLDVPYGAKNPDPEMAKISRIAMVRGAQGLVNAAKQMPTGLDHEWLDALPSRIEEELRVSGGVLRAHVIWGRKARLML